MVKSGRFRARMAGFEDKRFKKYEEDLLISIISVYINETRTNNSNAGIISLKNVIF